MQTCRFVVFPPVTALRFACVLLNTGSVDMRYAVHSFLPRVFKWNML